MSTGSGCQVHAGLIDDKCKLTAKAKKKFIQAIKDELTFGTANLPVPPLFPCGNPVPPNPFAALLPLEDEKKYPEFHKNILGTYEKIACALNLKSDFKLLPICCPISLGFKLGVDIKIPNFPGGFIPFMIPNPPLLALKMKIMPPPKLIAKFPGIPSVPPPLPTFPIPPDVKVPDFSTLFDFSLAFALNVPKFLVSLVANIPKLALQLPDLPGLFSSICKLAFDAKLFGNVDPGSVTQIVAIKVLTTKIVEMVFIAAVGSTLGSSPGGITGGIGKFLGYDPPEDTSNPRSESPRDKIVSYAKEMIDTSYGIGGSKQDTYASHLMFVEYPEPGKGPQADPRAIGKSRTLAKLKEASSCGLVARACLANGGASYVFNSKVDTSKQNPNVTLYYDFFLDRYQDGTAISGIYSAAKKKDAFIDYSSGDLPPLKKGDIIIVYSKAKKGSEHVLVLIKDYKPGSFTMTTVEGGQSDPKNANKPTAVKQVSYTHGPTVKKGSGMVSMYLGAGNQIYIAGRTVLALIDGEKLCTDQTGADMTRSHGSIDTSIAKDGSGFGFQKEA